MQANGMRSLHAPTEVRDRIHWVHGKRVMLDADLARFYSVTTFNLKTAVEPLMYTDEH
jgi:hypothetical protein